MKKEKLFFLMIFLSFLMLSSNLAAIDLVFHSGSGLPGETVEVDIDIITNEGEEVHAFGLNFLYDIANIVMTNDDDGLQCDLTQNFFIQSNDSDNNGLVTIGGYTTRNPILEKSSGCFLKIIFDVRHDAIAGEYPLTINHHTDDIENANIINGTFVVIAPTPTNTKTPTATISAEPSSTPTPTPPPGEISFGEKIQWERNATNNVDTIITIINRTDEMKASFINLYNSTGKLLTENAMIFKPKDMRLFFVSSEVPDLLEGFGYAEISGENEESFALWSAVINEKMFKGYTLPVVTPSLDETHIIPFWQVIPGKIDTQITCSSSDISGTNLTLTLFNKEGEKIKTLNYTFPLGELGRISLEDNIDYSIYGSAMVEFESSGLAGGYVTGVITNKESSTSYPLMVDLSFEAVSAKNENVFISVPFWQVLPREGIDTIFAFHNPDEIDEVSIRLSLYDIEGRQIIAPDFTIAPKNMKLIRLNHILPEGEAGIGSALLSLGDGTIYAWNAVYKASNQTGYLLSMDFPIISGTKTIPFWQYDPDKDIDTYFIVKNLGYNETTLSFEFFDTDGSPVVNNDYIVTPQKVKIYPVSEILSEKGIGYGFISWDHAPFSMWGLIFSNETETGFTIDFE